MTPAQGNIYHLPEGIIYYPGQNIIQAQLPAANIVFSRFVLEHVTPDDMLAMHVKFAKELPKGAYVIHFISPSDHRAYSDKSISLQDFLRYSQKEWDQIQTRFDYHNRLRLPEYKDIFAKSGLDMVHMSWDFAKPGSKNHEKFKAVPIHSDYQKYSDEELTAGSIKVVMRVG